MAVIDEKQAHQVRGLFEGYISGLAKSAQREDLKQRIAKMTEFLDEQSGDVEEYDEQLVRRPIEKVTVYEDKFVVEFKSNVEIHINDISRQYKQALLQNETGVAKDKAKASY